MSKFTTNYIEDSSRVRLYLYKRFHQKLTSIVAYKNNLNPIPALVLKENLLELEELIGKPQTDRIFNKMVDLGFDFSSESQSYFIHEVREALDVIFGARVAALIMQRIEGSLQ